MQIKITWLGLGWQYHVAKQFLLGISLVRIRLLSVCPEQAARMFVQFCLFGLRAGIRFLTHRGLFVGVEGWHPLPYL